jgi:hypothetical protein
MLAMEDSASIFCARLMRGTMSMAMTVAPVALGGFEKLGARSGVEEAHQRLAGAQQRDLGRLGRADLDHHVGDRGAWRRRDHLHPGRAVGVVGEARGLARAGFDQRRVAELGDVRGRLGGERDPRLARMTFLERADPHGPSPERCRGCIARGAWAHKFARATASPRRGGSGRRAAGGPEP